MPRIARTIFLPEDWDNSDNKEKNGENKTDIAINNPFKKTLEEATYNKRIAIYFTAGSEREVSAKIAHYEKKVAAHSMGKVIAFYYESDGFADDKQREERKRLLDDARAGKFDVIITKHFGRLFFDINERLAMIRELSSLPQSVGVYYEREAFYTLGQASDDIEEYMATLHARMKEEVAHREVENVGLKYWEQSYGKHAEFEKCSFETVCKLGDVFYGVKPYRWPHLVQKFTVIGISIDQEGIWYRCSSEDIDQVGNKENVSFPEYKFKRIMCKTIEEAEEDL